MYIYVGNFPDHTTEQDLRSVFQHFGLVQTVRVITDPISHRGLGFGFVEMPDNEEGRRAVDGLNLTTLHGRTIMVARTKDRVERRAPIPQTV